MQTIGEKLEEGRKRRGISLREAAEVTKIRSEYLGSFESNSFDLNLPEVYIRGFLRAYAQFLKLNADKIITDYNAYKLGESKLVRTESREFLGRMDISTNDAGQQERNESATPARTRQAPAPAGTTESGLEYNNFDKGSLIKAGAIAAAATVMVAIVVFLVIAILKSGPDEAFAGEPAATSPTTARQEVILIASGGYINNITVTERSTGLELFRGPLPAGERQRIPFDEQVRLAYTHAEFLHIEHNGVLYEVGGRGIRQSSFPPTSR